MSAYAVIPMIFGIVLLIHRFWLRSASSDEHKPAVRTRIVILGGGFGPVISIAGEGRFSPSAYVSKEGIRTGKLLCKCLR